MILKLAARRAFSVPFRMQKAGVSYLINDPKYAWLRELGLQESNAGVFTGEWRANGKPIEPLNPANNRPIAQVLQATKEDFEVALKASKKAFEQWCEVRGAVPAQRDF